MNGIVYIVLEGQDCEGGFIRSVFVVESDAIDYIKKYWSTWEEISPHERRRGCESVWVEEWGVK